MALYEDKLGLKTRATKSGLLAYRENLSNAAKASPKFHNRTVHHLLSQEILADPDIVEAGIPGQYEEIDLPDDFVLSKVIPVFEEYSFADARIDAIGAVFEALARRAEKGQPDRAVLHARNRCRRNLPHGGTAACGPCGGPGMRHWPLPH